MPANHPQKRPNAIRRVPLQGNLRVLLQSGGLFWETARFSAAAAVCGYSLNSIMGWCSQMRVWTRKMKRSRVYQRFRSGDSQRDVGKKREYSRIPRRLRYQERGRTDCVLCRRNETGISPITEDFLSSIAIFGRPRGRNVDSSPSCSAVASCHDAEANGRPCTTEACTVSRSFSSRLGSVA